MPAFRKAAAIAVVALVGLAPAAARERPPPLPPGSWNVNWGDHRCALIRQSESSPPEYFALQVVPGSHRSDLRVISRNWPEGALADLSRVRFTFEPGGTVVEGLKRVEETPGGRAFVIADVPADLRGALAGAASVRVARDGATLVELAVPASSRALAAFRECEVTVMREWGIDPDVQAAVRIPPRGNLAAFVRNTDYPSSALRRSQQGDVIFRLDVDRDGRAAACSVLVGSGHEALDNATCRVMLERARLEPAIGHDGRAVPAVIVVMLSWRIRG